MPTFKNKTPLPTNTPPVKKVGFFGRILNFAANDENYVPDIREKTVKVAVKPVSLWKRIKALLIVLVTFYLLLCVYILLNPQFAQFFIRVFKIDILVLRTILEYTIYTVYSIFAIVLAIGLIFFWYRAMTIKTHKRGKHLSITLLAGLFGILFFGNIALFAWTYNWFLQNFLNDDSNIVVYDNTYLKYLGKNQDISKAIISSKKNIGPIHVRYDLNRYISRESIKTGLRLDSPYTFEIDYDGDARPDRWSGDSNGVENSIASGKAPIITPDLPYNKVGTYKPKAIIKGVNTIGAPITVEIDMPEISLEGIVTIDRTNLDNGGIQYSFKADQNLTSRGQLEWSILGREGSNIIDTQYSPASIFTTPTIICLKIFNGIEPDPAAPCDWRFVTEESTKSNIQNPDIKTKIDPINPLKYQFMVEPTTLQWEVRYVRWYIDSELYVGKFDSGTEKIFDYKFHDPGTYRIEAEIEDSFGNIVRIGRDPVFTAELVDLKEGYKLQIADENNVDVSKNTYDKKTMSYLLPDFPVPWTLSFDATGIRADSPRLSLKKVEWDGDGDGVFETEWLTFEKDLPTPGRYDIRAKYTFTDISVDGKDIPIIHIDKIAVVGIQKSLDVRVKIIPESSYAPTSVRFDASDSKTLKGDIRKFIYDFGDGNKHEGEGIVTTYKYKNPGEYKITVTAVTNKGEKASRTYTLILKKPQETVDIQPSIASGLGEAELPITFSAKIQGIENIITWNFGDGTDIAHGRDVVHVFRTGGTYTINVKVEYASGIEESDTITYIVK